jgi:forkhead box protein P
MELGSKEVLNGVTNVQDNSMDGYDNKTDHLYCRRDCNRQGCNAICDDFHPNARHTSDGRTTAQARLEMQEVSELEFQLQKERELLQGIMRRFQIPESEYTAETGNLNTSRQSSNDFPALSEQSDLSRTGKNQNRQNFPSFPSSQPPPKLAKFATSQVQPVPTSAMSSAVPVLQLRKPYSDLPIRKRNTYRSASPLAGGASEDVLGRRAAHTVAVDITEQLGRKRELYKRENVRPPFTYSSLIRQAIIESPAKQLPLNEIYSWFENTFRYFRHNAETWKNTVRHNLSLHKCFKKAKVKPAAWTVDEAEFCKLRPRRYAAWAEQYEDPTMTQSLRFHGDALNASLQAALGESNKGLINSSKITPKATSPGKIPS